MACSIPDYQQRIRAALPFRSKGFTRLATYLQDGYVEAAFMTAAQLAHVTDVDVGTVVRFAQRLGYRGFPELQASIRDHVRRLVLAIPTLPAASPFHHTLLTLAQALQQAAHLTPSTLIQDWHATLLGSAHVVLVGQTALHTEARVLQQALNAHRVPATITVPDALLASPHTLQSGDLVILLEDDPSAPWPAALCQAAHRRQARVAVIGVQAASSAACLADRVLVAHATTLSPPFTPLVAALTLALASALHPPHVLEEPHATGTLSTP